MAKYEVRLCFSGFITVEVEAKNKDEAWDKGQEAIKDKEFTLERFEDENHFTLDQMEDLIDSLERRDDADQINEIKE